MVKKNEGKERKELHAGHFLLKIVLNDAYQGRKRRIGVSMHTQQRPRSNPGMQKQL